MAHTTARGPSDTNAAWLVNSEQGLAIIGAALESRHTDANADCSNLVHEIYARAGFTYSYANSLQLYDGIKEFKRVTHPQPGDLAVWRGHVGIVISPAQHSFFSAMRSGRGMEFYDSPYWQKRGQPRFFHYVKAASRNQWVAAIRKADVKSSHSRNAETHDLVAGGERPDAVAGTGIAAAPPVEVSGRNSSAASTAVEATQDAAPHKSESQTGSDAPSAIDPNKPATTKHKIQGPGDGVWEKTANKPSAGIPFDSVAALTPPPEPRPSPGLRMPNISAQAENVGRVPAASGAPPKPLRAEPVHWAMSRYVPRPPWSLPRGNSAAVPRPPARRTARAPAMYLPTGPAW